MAPAVVLPMDKVCSIVRKIYGRSPTDDLIDLDVNIAVWGIFMNVTLQAGVDLGRDTMKKLGFTKNQILESVKQLCQVTEKLIEYQRSETSPRLDGDWDEQMMLQFAENGHPIFRAKRPGKMIIKKQRRGKEVCPLQRWSR